MARTTVTSLKRHGTDLVSLVAGVIFLGVVGTWILDRTHLLPGIRGWLIPVLLIGVGIAGLIGIRPSRNSAAEVATDEQPHPNARDAVNGDDA
ncbi:MAG: hypothetical protein WCB04_08775 [Mycobacteriales bacterium]